MKVHIPIDGTEESGRTLCGRDWPEGAVHGGSSITCLTCLREANATISTEMAFTNPQLFDMLSYYISGYAMARIDFAKTPLTKPKLYDQRRDAITRESEALNRVIKEIKRRMPR